MRWTLSKSAWSAAVAAVAILSGVAAPPIVASAAPVGQDADFEARDLGRLPVGDDDDCGAGNPSDSGRPGSYNRFGGSLEPGAAGASRTTGNAAAPVVPGSPRALDGAPAPRLPAGPRARVDAIPAAPGTPNAARTRAFDPDQPGNGRTASNNVAADAAASFGAAADERGSVVRYGRGARQDGSYGGGRYGYEAYSATGRYGDCH